MPAEVSRMEARRQLVLPAWKGLVLVAVGFSAFVVSYFLLPLYFTECPGSCFYIPSGTHDTTTWEFTLNLRSGWEYWANELPHVDISLVTDTLVLALCYLPLLAAVTVVGCGVGFLVRPHRALARWGHRAWWTGSIVLGTMLLLTLLMPLLSLLHPGIGYVGMLVGYALLWGGNRVFRTAASVT
jgi:hypothetical protein